MPVLGYLLWCTLGRRAVTPLRDIHIPSWWKHAAERILKNRWRKILVVGASDRGKSTYCLFLCRTLCEAGFPVAFVDADVGQKNVGPPATISLAVLEGKWDLSTWQPERLYFVGNTSPVGRMLPMIVGTRKMVDAADTPFVVVDTTGLVHGPGRILKAYQIDSIQPDAVVCIEHHQELEPLVRSHPTVNIIRIGASRHAVLKSRQERAAARERSFRAYFNSAGDVNLKIPDVVFQPFSILDAIQMTVDGSPYAEEYPDGIIGVSKNRKELFQADMTALRPGLEQNLLCGVLDGRGDAKGLALLNKMDLSHQTVSLCTPVPAGKIKVLQQGDLYLNRDGKELGYVAHRRPLSSSSQIPPQDSSSPR